MLAILASCTYFKIMFKIMKGGGMSLESVVSGNTEDPTVHQEVSE